MYVKSYMLFLFEHESVELLCILYFFFFNDTATTEIYTLSLHDALPITTPQGTRRREPHGDRTPVARKVASLHVFVSNLLRLAYRRPRMSIQGDEQDPKHLMEKVPQEPIPAENPSENDQDEDVPEKDDERSRGGQA